MFSRPVRAVGGKKSTLSSSYTSRARVAFFCLLEKEGEGEEEEEEEGGNA